MQYPQGGAHAGGKGLQYCGRTIGCSMTTHINYYYENKRNYTYGSNGICSALWLQQ